MVRQNSCKGEENIKEKNKHRKNQYEKTPTTKKNTSTASIVETKIKNSISLKVSRLKDGNILFAIYNGSNYFIPSMDVTCNIYGDRGRLLNVLQLMQNIWVRSVLGIRQLVKDLLI